MPFFFDSCKQFLAERLDSLRPIEGQTLIHLSTVEVAGHAIGLKYGFDLPLEINSRICVPVPAIHS